ncbi:MAG TPA: RNA polymerase sigma factor [Polyangiaceae bacterium]|nr:RNA polymerase sigma factor [Polyangiaceae bacterium]
MNRRAPALANTLPSSGDVPSVIRRTDELLAVAREAAQGSPPAVRALVLQVGPAVLATVRKVLGSSHADLDDVAQDAVIALLDALDRFRGESSVMTFARRIALLTALAARRKHSNRLKYLNVALLETNHELDEQSPQTILAAKRRRETMLRLLDELPEPTAEALALHFVLGMTVEEIAESTDAPENTVWSRLRLGKQALRRRLCANSRTASLLEEAE